MTKAEIKRSRRKHYLKNRDRILRERRSTKSRRMANESKRKRLKNPEQLKKYKLALRRWRKKNPERIKIHLRKSSYGINDEQYKALLKTQNNKCAICFKKFDGTPHIDHDHACCSKKAKSCGKCIRGLLCQNCNFGLGRLKDSIKILESAIRYLKAYNGGK